MTSDIWKNKLPMTCSARKKRPQIPELTLIWAVSWIYQPVSTARSSGPQINRQYSVHVSSPCVAIPWHCFKGLVQIEKKKRFFHSISSCDCTSLGRAWSQTIFTLFLVCLCSHPVPNFFLHWNNCPEGKTLLTSEFLALSACKIWFLIPLLHSNLKLNLTFTVMARVYA